MSVSYIYAYPSPDNLTIEVGLEFYLEATSQNTKTIISKQEQVDYIAQLVVAYGQGNVELINRQPLANPSNSGITSELCNMLSFEMPAYSCNPDYVIINSACSRCGRFTHNTTECIETTSIMKQAIP